MTENTGGPEGSRHGRVIRVGAGAVERNGLLSMPPNARGLVLLAQGVEGIEHNSSYAAIAEEQAFYTSGLATLLIDLFDAAERKLDAETGYFRTNTSIMEQRIVGIAEWLTENAETQNLAVGYFGIGSSGASALIAAAERPDVVHAVVAAGAQLDTAEDYLRRVMAPTLLIAAEKDAAGVKMAQEALESLAVEKRFEQIAGVASLSEGQNVVSELVRLASEWFAQRLEPIV